MTKSQPVTEDVKEVNEVKAVDKPKQTPRASKPARPAATTPGAIAVASLRKKQRY